MQREQHQPPLFKDSRALALAGISIVEGLMLVQWSPLYSIFPLLALLTLLGGRRFLAGNLIALVLLAIGAFFLFKCAPLNAFIAFSYPAVFISIFVTTQPIRLFTSLVTLVLLSAFSTLLLDLFQQDLQHGDKKVIVFSSLWAAGEKKEPIYQKLFQEFEALHPEYKVLSRFDGRWVLAKNRPRLLTGKDIPDIIESGKEELRIISKENYSVDLSSYLNSNSPHTNQPWKDDWIPDILRKGSYKIEPKHPLDNKPTLLPNVVYNFFWFYNKALARKLDIQFPLETWKDFIQACEKAKQSGYEAIMLDNVYKQFIYDTMLQANLPPGELYKTVHGLPGFKPFTHPQYIRIFELQRLMADQYLMKGWEGSQFPKGQQSFATGKGLLLLCGSWLPGELREVAIQDKNIFELGCMPLPRFADEPRGTYVLGLSGWTVMKGGKEREGAIKLLQFLSDRFGKPIALEDGNQVPFVRDPLPPEFADVEEDFKNLKRAVNEPLNLVAPKWKNFIFAPMQSKFIQMKLGQPDYIDAQTFCEELEKETQKYRNQGGESRWE